MPWSVLAAVIGAGGAAASSKQNADAAKKAARQGTTTESGPWSGQVPYLQQLFAEAQKLYNSGQLGQVAGFAPDEVSGRAGLRTAADNINTMLPQIQSGWQSALNAPDLNTNPYIQNYISSAINPIQQRLQEQILPSIRSDAVSSGMFGGSRQGVGEGLAARGFVSESGDITSRILMNAYQQGLQQQMQALKLSPVIAQLNTVGPDIYRMLGAEERSMNQSQLDSAYQALQRYQGTVGGQGYGASGRTINPSYVGNNAIGSAFGGAASGLALYNMLNQNSGNSGGNVSQPVTTYSNDDWFAQSGTTAADWGY